MINLINYTNLDKMNIKNIDKVDMNNKINMYDKTIIADNEINLDKTGKHYMVDKKLLNYIVDEAMLLPNDVVLEIGCGHGELTYLIAKKCKVIAVDIDDNGVSGKNIVFVKGNILKLFLDLYKKYGFNKIVANIPYNISEPLMKLIFKVNLELIILTVGENFYKILSSRNNRLGIITNELYDVELLKYIMPKSFMPQPKVKSALIILKQKDIDIVDKPAVIYKELVVLENKKLKNTLINLSDGNKKDLKKKFNSNLFDKKLYQLTNEEFIKLDVFLRSFLEKNK